MKNARKKQFKYLHKLIAEFWKRWTFKYLTTMLQRNKNRVEKYNLRNNDLVNQCDIYNPSLLWPFRVVERAYTGNESLVRLVQNKTRKRKLSTRPLKIAL